MLTFLSPMFLVGAAAAAVPVVLHLLKREPEPRVKFAAVKMLKQAPVESTEKHRLRELLLLALRVATLVLLAIAFARPFFASGAAAGSSSLTVVALDTSFSMAVPGRFERARQLAKDAVARAPAGELIAVVTFDDGAEIVSRPSADRALALSALDEAAPGFGATRYRAALSAATQAVTASPARRATIILVTDLQENGWDEGDRASVPDGARVEIADVGPLGENLAVTAVRPFADRIAATIHNGGTHARDVRVRLTIDGRSAGEAVASVGANQSAEVTFPGAPRGIEAAVAVDDPDGPAADNVRYAALQGSRRPTVLIVSGSGRADRDAFYVRHALTAGAPGGRGYDVVFTSGAQLSADSSAGSAPLSSHAAVFLVSTRGLERHGREALASFVRNGGGLFIAAGPELDGAVAADVLGVASLQITHVPDGGGPRTLAPVDARHPVFRPFAGSAATLTLVRIRDAARIDADGCQTLARFTNGPRALLECAPGEGRALIFASDLDNRWNDFPLHASFVPFVQEAVRYLASARAYSSDYVIGDAPAGVPRRPGVHAIPLAGGTGPRRVAVNVDPRESDSSRLTAEEFQAAVTHMKEAEQPSGGTQARRQEDDQHLWLYALALMVLTLTAEGLIASRTA